MKKFSSLLIVLLFALASFTASAQNYSRGDVSQDGQVNITDVTVLINYLLNGTWPDEPVSPGDREYVDLGLPSGTLWATCNIGADSPEDYGDYFAWGETEPKDYYDWSTYKWCNGTSTTITKYCYNSSYGDNGFTDGKTELDPEDDAAYVYWGPSWRMPTRAQQNELRDNCTWTWTTLNGVNGYLVTGSNGNSIFLPAAGDLMQESNDLEGSHGLYWSRTLYTSYSYCAYDVSFSSVNVYCRTAARFCGFTVRAVRVSQE